MKRRKTLEQFILEANIRHNRIYDIIEIQGEQHYNPVKFSNLQSQEQAENSFIRQHQRDEQIRELCKKYDFNLIEIDIRNLSENKLIDKLKTIILNLNKNFI